MPVLCQRHCAFKMEISIRRFKGRILHNHRRPLLSLSLSHSLSLQYYNSHGNFLFLFSTKLCPVEACSCSVMPLTWCQVAKRTVLRSSWDLVHIDVQNTAQFWDHQCQALFRKLLKTFVYLYIKNHHFPNFVPHNFPKHPNTSSTLSFSLSFTKLKALLKAQLLSPSWSPPWSSSVKISQALPQALPKPLSHKFFKNFVIRFKDILREPEKVFNLGATTDLKFASNQTPIKLKRMDVT